MKTEHTPDPMTMDDVKRHALRRAKEAINFVISANNIEEKTPEWYRLMEVKTYLEQPYKV